MTNNASAHILNAMRTHGGSFVKALANAFDHADSENFHRLKAAFPDYWVEYAEIAALVAKKHAAEKV